MAKLVKRCLVCASGRGSNFQAVFRAVQSGKIRNCEIIGLLTDRPKTLAEAFAKEHGLRTEVLDFKSFHSRSQFDQAFFDYVGSLAPDLILTLGYMRILAPVFVRAYAGRIINIHPSLLPAFKGLAAPRQALEYGVRFSGASVHFVDEDLDTGPIISQAVVPLFAQDNEESLAERILQKEHELIVKAVDLFCTDNLKITGPKVELAHSV